MVSIMLKFRVDFEKEQQTGASGLHREPHSNVPVIGTLNSCLSPATSETVATLAGMERLLASTRDVNSSRVARSCRNCSSLDFSDSAKHVNLFTTAELPVYLFLFSLEFFMTYRF